MKLELDKPFRIANITIKNYKGLGSFELEFPTPRFDDEPDLLLIGGENGIGKSSIIECCALLLMHPKLSGLGNYLLWKESSKRFFQVASRLPDMLVNVNSSCADIEAEIEQFGTCHKVQMTINDKGICFGEEDLISDASPRSKQFNNFDENDKIYSTICKILGFIREPLVEDLYMYFNSYRSLSFETTELNGSQNVILDSDIKYSQDFNNFKATLIKSFLSTKENVLELDRPNGKQESVSNQLSNVSEFEQDKHSIFLDRMNSLVKKFVGDGKFSNIKILPDNNFDIRIKIGDENPFSIDVLGSGQKEIISTLFLIFCNTIESPDSSKIVIIDEPELHFNAQWHRKFIREMLHFRDEISQNQHILTTQSRTIADSVNAHNRIIIEKGVEQ